MSDSNVNRAEQDLLAKLREMLALQTNVITGLMDERFAGFESRLSEFQADVGTRFESFAVRFGSLEARFDHLEARFEHLEAGQIKVRSEIMDRIEGLQEKDELLPDDP